MKKIALLAFVAAAMMAPLSAFGGSLTKEPVLQGFHVAPISIAIVNNEVKAGVPLLNGAGFFYNVPRQGITVKVILYVTKGATVPPSTSTAKPSVPLAMMKNRPGYRDLHPVMVKDAKGVPRPTWVFHHLEQAGYPVWKFTVKVPSSMSQLCVHAEGRILTLPTAPPQSTKPACFTRKSIE